MPKKYKFEEVPDEDNFSVSECNCKSCRAMHFSIIEWQTFTPKTNLQKNMKRVIHDIENNARKKRQKTKDKN